MTTVWVRHGQSEFPPPRDDQDTGIPHHVTDDLVGWLDALFATDHR